ncbi:hypothetical protein GF324_01565 [bacterium]|nr:hypothetical protein [bacterium]
MDEPLYTHDEKDNFSEYFAQMHDVVMSAKGRFVLPAAFRVEMPPELLKQDFYMLPDPTEGCLIVRPRPEWQRYIHSLKTAPLPRKQIKRYLDAHFATEHHCKPDAQHRLFLSLQARRSLGLQEGHGKTDLVAVGAGSSFSLWTRERFPGEKVYYDDLAELKDVFENLVF